MRLHPQVEAVLARPGPEPPADMDDAAEIAWMRSQYAPVAAELGGEPEEVAHVEDVAIPRADGASVPARAYRPADAARGAIVWAHGGGWVVGDLDGIDRVCRSLANAAGAWVLSVDYRLAPEHPFPAGLDDFRRAAEWARGVGARGLGWDEDRVLVGGDSAGGNLAAVAALGASADGLPALRGQMLVYPVIDGLMAGESYRRFAEGPGLDAASMEFFWEQYLGGADPTDPDASPLHAPDLSGAAPAIVVLAGVDPLHDEGVAYAQALRGAGVACELHDHEDVTHGFLRWAGAVDAGRLAIAELGAWARARLA